MKLSAKLPRSRSFHAFRRENSGVAAVEFALLAPVLLVFLFAVTELAMARRARMQLIEAGLAAQRYAMLKGAADNAAMQTAARNATSLPVAVTSETYCACVVAASLSRTTCGTTCSTGAKAGTYVSAVTSATYKPVFPSPWSARLAGGSLNMSVTNIARTQ